MNSNIVRVFKNNPDYLRLISSTIIASMNNWGLYVVLLIIAEKITNTPFQFSLLLFFSGLAPLLFSYVLGALSDHLNIKKTLMITEVIRMMVLLGFLFVSSDVSWKNWLLYFILSFTNGMATSLNTITRQTIIPRLIDRDDLNIANSFNFAIMSSARLIGISLGGVIYSLIGLKLIVVIGVIGYGVSIFFLYRISESPVSQLQQKKSIIQNILSGGELIKNYPMVKYVILMAVASGMMLGSVMVSVTQFSVHIFKSDESGVSLLLGTEGIAAFIVSIVIAEKNIHLKKYYQYGWIYVAIGLCWMLFGISVNLIMGVMIIALYSAVACLIVPFEREVMQTKVTAHDMGRVFGLWNTASLVSIQLGTLFSGVLLKFVELNMLPIVFGFIEAAAGVYFYMKVKREIN